MRVIDGGVLLRIFWRNIAFIFLASIVGLLIGNYTSAKSVPMFRSSLDLFVSTPASAIDVGLLATGGTFSQERVKSYIQIINAPRTLDPVIKELELNTTAEALGRKISASAPTDTVVIRLSVVDSNPSRAAAIANAVGKQFAITAESLELPTYDSASPVKVSVVRPAVPEFGPISPKINTNRLLGITAMALFTYLFFLIKYFLDLTVKNISDLDGLPLLATIGFDPEADKIPLINGISPYEPRNEAYRSLRSNILNQTNGNWPYIVAVTSGLPEEGKSSLSINVAIAFSNQGIKTLVLEGDLRRPKVLQYLAQVSGNGRTKKLGLSNLLQLQSHSELRKSLPNVILEAFERVDFIHSGDLAQNPTELLANDRFSELLSLLKNKYQLIIVDCPPTLPIADSAVICRKVDSALLVVHAGRTRTKAFLSTKQIIEETGTKVIGVVLNKIPNNRNSEDYGYASGYKRYYRNAYSYFFLKRGYKPYGPYDYRPSKKDVSNERKFNPSPIFVPPLLGLSSKLSEKRKIIFKKREISSKKVVNAEIAKWLDEITENATRKPKPTSKSSSRKKSI